MVKEALSASPSKSQITILNSLSTLQLLTQWKGNAHLKQLIEISEKNSLIQQQLLKDSISINERQLLIQEQEILRKRKISEARQVAFEVSSQAKELLNENDWSYVFWKSRNLIEFCNDSQLNPSSFEDLSDKEYISDALLLLRKLQVTAAENLSGNIDKLIYSLENLRKIGDLQRIKSKLIELLHQVDTWSTTRNQHQPKRFSTKTRGVLILVIALLTDYFFKDAAQIIVAIGLVFVLIGFFNSPSKEKAKQIKMIDEQKKLVESSLNSFIGELSKIFPNYKLDKMSPKEIINHINNTIIEIRGQIEIQVAGNFKIINSLN